ncbi:MAG: hypothetical protein KDA61_10720 [Planctomycetales bacterium]|nr:hypothetical protein [Planctomycetales bacterium]
MSFDAQMLPPRQMFRFSIDVKQRSPLWTPQTELDETYRLPDFAALDGRHSFADVRMAWSREGLLWQVEISGKTQPLWCRDSRLEDSDGLQVWVDTRATLNVHRATRFAHRFAFLPAGGSPRNDAAVADQLLINRARENARPVRPRELQVRSKVTSKGYKLWAFAPADALGGFDPQQQPKLGFTYAVIDRELGLQTLAMGPEFPYEEDPSCWAEVALLG